MANIADKIIFGQIRFSSKCINTHREMIVTEFMGALRSLKTDIKQ